MSRTVIALAAGLVGLVAYLLIVLAIADHVIGLHWAVQAVFFLVAGVAWAWPIARLMRWSAAGR